MPKRAKVSECSAEMIYDINNLVKAHQNARRGKSFYSEVQMVDSNPAKYLYELQDMEKDGTYKTSEYEAFWKQDGEKLREIFKLPYYPDRIHQWAIIQVIEPVLLRHMTDDTYSAIPGRGTYKAYQKLVKALKTDPVGTRWCLKLDIKKYYPNINKSKLKAKYDRMFKDKRILSMLYEIIDSTPGVKGVPIGNYISQYSGNIYLSDFDHRVKEVYHVKHYFRYMDDMVIFDTDKARLHEMRKKISEYLSVELNVELKDNWQVFPLAENREDNHARPLDFMGFKFYRNHTTLRKSILKHIRRKSARINAKIRTHQNVTWKDASSIVSYMGWITHSDTYHYYFTYIRSNVIIRSMKYKVSKHHRKESKHYDRLEISAGFSNRPSVGGRYLFKYDNCVPA